MTLATSRHCLIGTSTPFRKMLQSLEKMAGFDAPVLITGETGSGKEMVARAIHYLSKRRQHPFVPLNCGALPDHLVENELFGHRRGAYTDAREPQPGLIAQAEGGTLFLDEIDALTAKAQVALLRFLQDGSYRPLGAASPLQANVRILAATHVDLIQAMEKGSFRSDLHYRLNVLELHVPALRQRPDDIPLLAKHVIRVTAERYGLHEKPVHPQTLDWLKRQPWPGNVRELENTVQRAFLMSDEVTVAIPQAQYAEPGGSSAQAADMSHNTLNFNDARYAVLHAFEHSHLTHLMQVSAGNVTQAARLAGKERRALGKLLKAHGIEPARFRTGY